MISKAVRKEVMERDHGNCQFFHREPVPATEISHHDHQGIGGLPEDHWKNQPPNLAASCTECHRFKLHHGYLWEKFVSGDLMIIYDPSGEMVPDSDLWFYVRHEAERLQKTEARIQGLAIIEGDIAKDLYELSQGFKLLEPDAVSFAQYIAGRNVSAERAVEAARAYEWMYERPLFWPPGLTSQKADIVRKAVRDDKFDAVSQQEWLDGAVDQSVSDLKSNLADAKLIDEPVRWYVHIRPKPFDGESPIIGGQMMLIRARKVEKVLAVTACPWQGNMVLRADKFVAGLNWDRKTGILSDRDGNEIPYKDLS